MAGREQHFAAHMAALLLRAELILEMDRGGTGIDVRLRELVHIQRPAESGLGVGDDWDHPMAAIYSLGPLDLVGSLEGVVDTTHQLGTAVDGVQRLIGVDLTRRVGVARHLPPG